MKSHCHLVIFARTPVLGQGKRRLARGIGAVQAVRFQRARLKVLLAQLAGDRRWTTWLAVTPDSTRFERGPWPSGVHVIGQGRGDLGRRMGRAFKTLPPGRVVLIGTDIPAIVASDVAVAFRALGGHDAVFGPAADGGYWLVGFKRTPRIVLPFKDVRWSTRHALADTERNLAGMRVARGRVLNDVDEAADLQRQAGWARVVRPT